MAIRVILADDHVLIRESLKLLLERQDFRIIAEATDGREVLRQIELQAPEIVVMNIAMPVLNGIETARTISHLSPTTKTILLTQLDGEQYVSLALGAGVKGYVLKSQAVRDLVQAMRYVCEGGIYLSPGISRAAVEGYRSISKKPTEILSPRERQVLQLIAEGKSGRDVACVLGISVKTAFSHRARLMRKLDIHETAGLVRYAVARGMIQP